MQKVKLFPPYKIKTVEKIPDSSVHQRKEQLRKAHFNLFGLPSSAVTLDLLTDSGTGALSDDQWAELLRGDEAYAGSRSYEYLVETVQAFSGFPYIIPTHQGRSAEFMLSHVLLDRHDMVVSNSLFDTTRANFDYRNIASLDLICSEGEDPASPFRFKGNLHEEKFREAIKAFGGKIKLLVITVTNNALSGQPVALSHIQRVSELAKKNGMWVFCDASRFAENLWFIREYDSGYRNVELRELSRKFFACFDGFWMSAKKDGLQNIGGIIGLRCPQTYEKVREFMLLFEGFPTYGGLAGRDMAALAKGFEEVLSESYLRYRIDFVAWVGEELKKRNIPIFEPTGGHAVYIRADQLLPHLASHQFPGQSLAIFLYLVSGLRSSEVGSLMRARKNPISGELEYPPYELLRLAIPRRVYFEAHFESFFSDLEKVRQIFSELPPVYFRRESSRLRHFFSEFSWDLDKVTSLLER